MPDRTRGTCATCGNAHDKCTAHTRAKQPCGMNPAEGADVCRMHGGAAPQVKAAAKTRVQEQIAASAVARWAIPVEISPSEGLLAEVHRTAGVIAWAEAQVVRVTGDTPDNLVRGTRSVKRTVGKSMEGPVDVTATEVGPLLNFWVDLWQKERKHFVDVCKVTLAAGVEERRVQLAEQDGERAGRWLQACLEVLDLGEADVRRVMAEGVRHLHLLRSA